MHETLKLGLKDRALLFILFALILIILIFVSFCVSNNYLVLGFNVLFIFTTFFYLMLFLNKHNAGKAKPPTKFPLITVVIPCFNSKNTILECINSIKRIKYPKKVNILVVDDCSTDGSREILRKIKGIELLELEKNCGRSVAVNTALKQVKTEFVIPIDSDSYPESDILMKTMGYFDDASVASVSCLVLPDKRDSLLRKIQTLEYAVSFGLMSTLLSSINSSYVVPGPFTIFRKKVFDIVGYYEAGNMAEDTEFGLRMKNHSMKLMNCHEAVVYTDVPNNIHSLFIQRNRWCRGGTFNFIRYRKLLFNKKNPDFGFFVMPFLFILQIFVVAVLARLVLFMSYDLFVFLQVMFRYLSLGGIISFDMAAIVIPPSLIFFVAAYTLLTMYFLVCFWEVKYKLKLDELLAFVILIFIYPYFVSFTYSQGYFKEIFGVGEAWRRVST